jgi:hypothetical protein
MSPASVFWSIGGHRDDLETGGQGAEGAVQTTPSYWKISLFRCYSERDRKCRPLSPLAPKEEIDETCTDQEKHCFSVRWTLTRWGQMRFGAPMTTPQPRADATASTPIFALSSNPETVEVVGVSSLPDSSVDSSQEPETVEVVGVSSLPDSLVDSSQEPEDDGTVEV